MNITCRNYQKRYYAGQVWLYSLPLSTYGLDVLAWIGWQHEHEHRQLVEIQRMLNQRGITVNERNVGKLYRQFLALLSATSENMRTDLANTTQEYGGLIWAADALQLEGPSGLLYVLYEVLSGKPVAAFQCEHANEDELVEWLRPYAALGLPVLATLSDGEKTVIAAIKTCWPEAPHQRCQVHFLNNLTDEVLDYDDKLDKQMRQDLGGLLKVPHRSAEETQPPRKRCDRLAGAQRWARVHCAKGISAQCVCYSFRILTPSGRKWTIFIGCPLGMRMTNQI